MSNNATPTNERYMVKSFFRWVKSLWQTRPIHIPRTPGTPRQNYFGMKIHRGFCPRCACEEFFSGPPGVIFCGNENCRAGFKVWNYGDGKVFAEQTENGPDHLYR